jgi:23S rRNA pseudouridine1911/1915/1917 synthase
VAHRDLSEPLREITYSVEPAEAGQRLDTWLQSRVSWRSRSDLQRRIAEGRVLVDGQPARKGAKLKPGQEVRVLVDGPAAENVPVHEIPLRVIHEDQCIIVLDKAPGTVVHPVGRHVMDTIVNALHVRHHSGEGVPGPEPPMIVHRLDRETSGVLVFAKDDAVRRRLGADFEKRRVKKSYLAVVSGPVPDDSGTIDLPIGPDLTSEIKLKVACVADGKPSRTDYEIVRRTNLLSLVRCRPHTGRQHQIRVHLAALGHPILCDRLYGNPTAVTAAMLDPEAPDPGLVVLDRQALHAERLAITHPTTGETMSFESPLPADLAALVGAP